MQADCQRGWRAGGRCETCQRTTHVTKQCPEIWRGYLYVDSDTRLSAPARWCYNCAEPGHYGDDCPAPRGHPLRLYEPSVFSESIAGHGPCKMRHRDDRPGVRNHRQYGSSHRPNRQALSSDFSNIPRNDSRRNRPRRNADDDTADWFSDRIDAQRAMPTPRTLAPVNTNSRRPHASAYPYPRNSVAPAGHNTTNARGARSAFASRIARAPQYQGGYT